MYPVCVHPCARVFPPLLLLLLLLLLIVRPRSPLLPPPQHSSLLLFLHPRLHRIEGENRKREEKRPVLEQGRRDGNSLRVAPFRKYFAIPISSHLFDPIAHAVFSIPPPLLLLLLLPSTRPSDLWGAAGVSRAPPTLLAPFYIIRKGGNGSRATSVTRFESRWSTLSFVHRRRRFLISVEGINLER